MFQFLNLFFVCCCRGELELDTFQPFDSRRMQASSVVWSRRKIEFCSHFELSIWRLFFPIATIDGLKKNNEKSGELKTFSTSSQRFGDD